MEITLFLGIGTYSKSFKFMLRQVFIFLLFVILFIFFHNSAFASDPVINEFLPNPPSGSPEWVEFYNVTNAAIDLSDYYFDDETNFDSDSGSSAKIALSGLLPALQACYWGLSSYLNNNGDSPTLFKVQNGVSTIVDTYIYASSSAGLSYARIPDGESWAILQQPTQGSNKCIDLAPTLTPTPTLTLTPTLTSTPTPTPTPTKTPTPSPKKSPSPTLKPTSAIASPTSIEPTDEVIPTSVLGESTENENKDNDKSAKTTSSKEMESRDQSNNLSAILISIGVIFLIVCGILVFRSYKRNKEIS